MPHRLHSTVWFLLARFLWPLIFLYLPSPLCFLSAELSICFHFSFHPHRCLFFPPTLTSRGMFLVGSDTRKQGEFFSRDELPDGPLKGRIDEVNDFKPCCTGTEDENRERLGSKNRPFEVKLCELAVHFEACFFKSKVLGMKFRKMIASRSEK